jgi:uncharacterized metal-binding protein
MRTMFCTGLQRRISGKNTQKLLTGFCQKLVLKLFPLSARLGLYPKERIGIPDVHKVRPGTFETMCNPIAQAKLLNEQHTDFNIVVGL